MTLGNSAQRVLEHLADAGHFVLPVKREDHRKERVKLRSFHNLRDPENGFGELLLVRCLGQVNAHLQFRHVAHDEGILLPHTSVLLRK